jgi:hypothetical protein
MSYKEQTMSTKEMDQQLSAPLEVGEEYVEFVRVQINEWEDAEFKRGDPRDSDDRNHAPDFTLMDGNGPKYLLINLTHRIVEGSPGKNRDGMQLRSEFPFSILLDNEENPVMGQLRTKMDIATLTRIVMTYFGGTGPKSPGDYPTDGDNLKGVLNVLSDSECVEALTQRPAISMVIEKRTAKESGREYVNFKNWHATP